MCACVFAFSVVALFAAFLKETCCLRVWRGRSFCRHFSQRCVFACVQRACVVVEEFFVSGFCQIPGACFSFSVWSHCLSMLCFLHVFLQCLCSVIFCVRVFFRLKSMTLNETIVCYEGACKYELWRKKMKASEVPDCFDVGKCLAACHPIINKWGAGYVRDDTGVVKAKQCL